MTDSVALGVSLGSIGGLVVLVVLCSCVAALRRVQNACLTCCLNKREFTVPHAKRVDEWDGKGDCPSVADKERPLRDFSINSSHNSYINCWQNVGFSNEFMISKCLDMGARLIELDVGPGLCCCETAVVAHKPCCFFTTTVVGLTHMLDQIEKHPTMKDVVKADGTVVRPDPLFINIELNLSNPNDDESVKVQDYVAAELEKRFGELLWVPAKDGYGVAATPISRMVGRIIIVGTAPGSKSVLHKYTIKFDEVDVDAPEAPAVMSFDEYSRTRDASIAKVDAEIVRLGAEGDEEGKAYAEATRRDWNTDPKTEAEYKATFLRTAYFWNKGENPTAARATVPGPPWSINWWQSIAQSMMRLFPGEAFIRNFSVNVPAADRRLYQSIGIQTIALNFSHADDTLADNQAGFQDASFHLSAVAPIEVITEAEAKAAPREGPAPEAAAKAEALPAEPAGSSEAKADTGAGAAHTSVDVDVGDGKAE